MSERLSSLQVYDWKKEEWINYDPAIPVPPLPANPERGQLLERLSQERSDLLLKLHQLDQKIDILENRRGFGTNLQDSQDTYRRAVWPKR